MSLFQQALEVRERAHAPYSRFKVGAAIRSSSGKFFLGCNVENVAYLEVTDSKKKKTMYIKRPVQINNILFADPEMKEQIKGFCVLSEAKESSDPIFQYQRGKKIK